MLNLLRNLFGGAQPPDIRASAPIGRVDTSGVSGVSALREGANGVSAVSPSIFSGSVMVMDFAIIAFAGLVTALIYLTEPGLATSQRYLTAVFATSAVAVILFRTFGVYKPHRLATVARNVPALAIGWAVAVSLLVTVVFLLKAGELFSRAWLVI